MANNRVTIIIDDDQRSAISELKRERYYDKSYAALFRDLINIALEAIERNV